MFVDLDKTALISLFCAVLFVMLFSLGLDSAFSFIDGFLICLSDTAFLGHVNTKYSTLGLTVVAWLLSFMYATDAGLIFLDTIDYYINFVMLLVVSQLGGSITSRSKWTILAQVSYSPI